MIQIFIISRYRKQEGFLNLAILPKIRFFTCFLSLLLVLISTVSATEDVKKFDSIAKEIEDNAFSYAEKSGKLIAELQSIDDKYPDNSYFSIQTLYWEARVNYLQSISDSTLLLQCIQYKKSLNEGKSYFEKALLHHTLSLCYMVEGNYTEAFSMALKSLEQFQRVKDTAFIIKTLNILGNICFKTENRKMATNYYEQALALTKPPQREYYSILMNLYTNLAYMKEHEEKAIDSLIVFVPRFENGPDKGLYAGICFNLSSILYGKGDEKGGYHYYCLSKECIEKYKIDNQVMKIGLYSFMATENTLQKKYKQALQYLHTAKKIAERNRNLSQLALILHQISDIYQESGHIDSAYYYLTLHDQLRTRLSNNSKTIEVYQEYISLSLESAKNELTIAEQAMTIRNKQLMVVIILAVGVILVITLLLIIMQQKKRSMLKRMEHEKQIQTLQKEKITLQKNELEMQVREITSYSVLLSNKNHTLQQIEGLLQQLLASDKNNEEKICKEINTIIKNNLNSDSERQSFMLHFGKVHPRFFEKLKNYCDDLTENNLHLCAYFRIGMSSKQIAQIMNVSFDTIRSNRYRLRKKLGLQEEEDLYDFLRKI